MSTTYFTDSSELTAIADAIRTKAGTSQQLVFPSGFINAVNSIEMGGEVDLNYSIICGASQPMTTKENTIEKEDK